MFEKPNLVEAMEKNLVFEVIEFVKDRKTVTLREIIEELELDGGETEFIRTNLIAFRYSEITSNFILGSVVPINVPLTWYIQHKKEDQLHALQLSILPTALFSYVDHIEILEARKATEQAREASNKSIRLAIKANWAAWVGVGISIVLGVLGLISKE